MLVLMHAKKKSVTTLLPPYCNLQMKQDLVKAKILRMPGKQRTNCKIRKITVKNKMLQTILF